MLRSVAAGAVLLALAVRPASAQGTLVVSLNKCPASRQAQIARMNDSLWLPVAQELVTEGRLTAAGTAYHSWGDEWNVVVWYTAKDTPAFLAAFSELTRRLRQRHPGYLSDLLSWCTEHKDNIYGVGGSTTPVPAAKP